MNEPLTSKHVSVMACPDCKGKGYREFGYTEWQCNLCEGNGRVVRRVTYEAFSEPHTPVTFGNEEIGFNKPFVKEPQNVT